MKRFVPAILALAIFFGVFAPITASLSEGRMMSVALQSAEAQTVSPTAAATAQDKAGGGATTGYGISAEMDSCGVIITGTLVGCLEDLLYFVPYTLGAWLLHFSAWVFDSLASITLSSTMYSGSQFVSDGWRVTRDFSNIFLILILLVTALAFILDISIGHASPKKLLGQVIIIAIVINFSMFITEVIIDTSNSLALVFYNQISTVGSTNPSPTTPPSGTVPPKTISAALVAAFEPAQLQSKEFWDGLRGGAYRTETHIGAGVVTGAAIGSVVPVIGTTIGAIVGGLAGAFVFTSQSTAIPPSIIIGILILVGVMYGVAAYAFFIASISFMGRLVGLWVAIIFSPFAFASSVMPSLDHKMGDMGWTGWWQSTISLAFSAPIFFFFLLLISLMTKSAMVTSAYLHQGSSLEILVVIFISFMFLIVMLLKATKYVKNASGEIGKMVFGGLQLVGGMALGATLGGVAYGGRRLAGSYFKKQVTDDNINLAAGVINNKTLDSLSNKFSHLTPDVLKNMSHEEIRNLNEFKGMQRDAERKLKTAQKYAATSFDLRQTGIGAGLSSFTGMNLESVGGLSTDRAAGGYDGDVARQAAKMRKFAELLGHSHGEQDEFDQVIENREVEIEKLESSKTIIETDNKKLELTQEFKDYLKAIETAKEERNDIRANNNYPNEAAKNTDLTKAAQKVADAEAAFIKYKKVTTNYDSNQKKIQDQTKKIQEQRKGEKNADGSDIVYTHADLNKNKFKADGSPVSERDVELGVVATESLSMETIKALKERNKNNREKSWMNMKMNQTGYAVEHQVFDQYGAVKKMGHINFNQQNVSAMKGWAKEAWKINASNLMNNTKNMKELVGNLKDVFSYGILGAMKEGMRSFSHNRDLPMGNRRIEGRAAQLAADKDHAIHEYKSKYKAAENGFTSFLKALSGGSGGGHGDSHAAGSGDHGGH